MKVSKNILEAVGNTPLVELNNLKEKLSFAGNIIAKVEFFNPAGSVKDRIAKAMIEEAVNDSNVQVDIWDGLTVRYAKEHGATHLIRGLRAVTDFEYEFQLASANDFADSSIDSVFLMSKGEKSFINSSSIMELYKKGVDVSTLVPPSVIKRLNKLK